MEIKEWRNSTQLTRFHELLKPTNYLQITSNFGWLRLLILFISVLSLSGFLLATMITCTDNQQGENYRIIYIHVPSAWMAMLLYLLLAINSIIFLLYRHPMSTFIIDSLSKTGIIYTGITLFTGSLWAFPMWGTFWVWDARLTSVLILFFLYLVHKIILISSQHTQMNIEKRYKIASIVSIIGFINLPIIKYSVDWWSTLHQGSSITQYQTQMHLTVLTPLLITFSLFLLMTVVITLYDMRQKIIRNTIRSNRLRDPSINHI